MLISPTTTGDSEAQGHCHPVLGVATRIGRLTDDDIVLDDSRVSRHHAVIIDTGTSIVVTDLRSSNGTEFQDKRIRGAATLADGDNISIGHHKFTFEIQPQGESSPPS